MYYVYQLALTNDMGVNGCLSFVIQGVMAGSIEHLQHLTVIAVSLTSALDEEYSENG